MPKKLAESVGARETETYLNQLNQAIQDTLETGGELFLSNAVVRGKYALRACIVNYNTTVEDVDAVPGVVTRVGRELHEAGGSS